MGSLGAQVIWAKLFAIGLGHEIPSVFSVVSAVMAGLAVGSLGWPRKPPGMSVLRAYCYLELILGLGVVASAFLILPWCRTLANWMGTDPGPAWHWGLSFLAPLTLLLPATAAMGATLPAMEAAAASGRRGDRGGLASAYAFNTFGAFLGCGLSTFSWMPTFGLQASLILAGSLNLVCAAWSWRLAGKTAGAAGDASIRNALRPTPTVAVVGQLSRFRILATLFCTGLLGMGLEVVGIRALAQLFENTVFSFATALAVFLVATALGAAAYQRWGRSVAWGAQRGVHFFPWVALGVVIGALFLSRGRWVYEQMLQAFPGSRFAVLGAEISLAVGVFFLPCLVMGALFVDWVLRAKALGSSPARAVAINYAGGSLAGIIFGLLLLPQLDFRWTFGLIAGAYLLLSPFVRSWAWAAGCVSVGLLSLAKPDLGLVYEPPGASVVAVRRGAMGTVSVVADAGGQRTLRLNNRFQMGGTAAAVAQRRQAHIPLLLHPNPRQALFIGPGTGTTVGAATTHSGLEIDAVELVPEILEMLPQFEPQNLAPQRNPRVHFHVADARRFVRVSGQTYDVIVADLFHPAQDGSGALYTREHFQSLRNRLAPGGLVCQWLPLHQLDTVTWKMILRTFRSVFLQTEVWLLHFNVDIPVVGLIGRLEVPPPDWVGRLERRFQEADGAEMRNSGWQNAVQFAGCRLAGPAQVELIAGSGSLNEDVFPRVGFLASQFPPHSGAAPPAPLMALLDELQRTWPTVARDARPDDRAFHEDGLIGDFARARDEYLRGLTEEVGGGFKPAVEHYFASAAASLYFTPSYARLVSIIQVMAQADPPRARELYERLLRTRPDQPLGRRMLEGLFQGKPETLK